MQLKMQRFSHVIHMALAEAEQTKPPEAYSYERQSYLSELQFCLEENGGGRLIFCQCCQRCLCQSTGCPSEFSWNFKELFPPLVSTPVFSPMAFYLVLSNFHACLLLSVSLPYIHVLLLPTKKLFWLKVWYLWWHTWTLLQNPLWMCLCQLTEMDGF